MSKVFIDTNVLVYSVNAADPARQLRARRLIGSIQETCVGVVSTQVIQEFYVAVTRRLGVEPLTARKMMDELPPLEVVLIDTAMIRDAVDCSILNRINFWDALIVAAARKARCTVLWTEDLNDGQTILSVTVRNPFADTGDSASGPVREARAPYGHRRRRRPVASR